MTCRADKLPSVALAVTLALPTATPEMVRALPDTLVVATSGSFDDAS